ENRTSQTGECPPWSAASQSRGQGRPLHLYPADQVSWRQVRLLVRLATILLDRPQPLLDNGVILREYPTVRHRLVFYQRHVQRHQTRPGLDAGTDLLFQLLVSLVRRVALRRTQKRRTAARPVAILSHRLEQYRDLHGRNSFTASRRNNNAVLHASSRPEKTPGGLHVSSRAGRLELRRRIP